MAHTIRLLVLEGLTPEHLLTLHRGGFFATAFDAPATSPAPPLPEGVTGQVARVSVPEAKAPAAPAEDVADPPPPAPKAPPKATKAKPSAPAEESPAPTPAAKAAPAEPAPAPPATKFAEEADDEEEGGDSELSDKLAAAKTVKEILQCFLDAGIGVVPDDATQAESDAADARLVEAVRTLRTSGHPVLARIDADKVEDRVLRTLSSMG